MTHFTDYLIVLHLCGFVKIFHNCRLKSLMRVVYFTLYFQASDSNMGF